MKYRRRQNVVTRQVAGEHVLIPTAGCTHSVYTLNEIALGLWDMLAEARTEGELAAALAGRFHLAPDRALADVRSFLSDLVRMDLIAVFDCSNGS
ncbi:MAG: PqqD family protein [bacterium]